MKNLMLVVALILSGTTFANAECVNGTCRAPIRNTVKAVVTAPVVVAKRVVTAPAKIYHKRQCNRCR